jgi:hypothetical protein
MSTEVFVAAVVVAVTRPSIEVSFGSQVLMSTEVFVAAVVVAVTRPSIEVS